MPIGHGRQHRYGRQVGVVDVAEDRPAGARPGVSVWIIVTRAWHS